MNYTWVKAILFILVWFASCVVVAIPVILFVPDLFDQIPEKASIEADWVTSKMLYQQIVYFAGTLLSFFIMMNIVGKKNLTFPPIKFNGFLQGGIIGIILILTAFAMMLISKSIEISYIGIETSSLLTGLLFFFFVAVNEELLFRGGILQLLANSYSKLWALIISSILFGTVHLFNSGITSVGYINLLLSGVIMGELYFRYDSVMPAISIHLVWNYLQGPILGFAVSGHSINGMLRIDDVKSPILSGGSFGIEGSIFTLAIQVVCIFILFRFPPRLKASVIINKASAV